jgi:hypothetical protein
LADENPRGAGANLLASASRFFHSLACRRRFEGAVDVLRHQPAIRLACFAGALLAMWMW